MVRFKSSGPWDSEPDALDWEHAGLKCAIRRAPLGHLCGYVGIPSGHPLYGVAYHQPHEALKPLRDAMLEQPVPDRLAVHLAILAGAIPDPCPDVVFDVHGGLTWSDDCVPGEKPDGLWWFGFDCAHHGDYTPNCGRPPFPNESYRDIEYVKAQTEKLAEQLAALLPAGGKQA